jgi:hypothetical protein
MFESLIHRTLWSNHGPRIVSERFHGGNTGSNPVGDAKSFQQLAVLPFLNIGTKKAQIVSSTRMPFIEEPPFSR